MRDSSSIPSTELEKFVIRPPQAWEETAAQVRRAFMHAYHGYERYAAPHDQLLPLSNNHSDIFNGWAVTIFDSLDTMLIMDLKNEYARAVDMIKKIEFSLPDGEFAPYFETIIRYLGGLLSAYALSNNQLFLDRADELAVKLDPVFNTMSGLALYSVNPTNRKTSGSEIGILAEIASLQLEYSYLAKLTGKKEHFQRAGTLLHAFENANLEKTGGMLPTRWNLTSAQPYDGKLPSSFITPHVSVGAQADSAHEYLLKQYLMTAKTDKASLKMYLRATTHIITNLLYISPTRHLLYVTDEIMNFKSGKSYPTHNFEHLSCFLPGLLALGAHTLPLDDLQSLGINLDDIDSDGTFGTARIDHETLAGFNLKKLHLWAAEGLAQTCYLTYADQPTGLGPDEMIFNTAPPKKSWDSTASQWRAAQGILWLKVMKKWNKSGSRGVPPGLEDKKPVAPNRMNYRELRSNRDYEMNKVAYLLRPETIESLYILWRVTGDLRWRERGWRIFAAIETHAKTSSGYASLSAVDTLPAKLFDDMPSYFLAETLKYLYLLFINDNPIPLEEWVFNTEAHPFPVFEWTEQERQLFGIL
ncbi:Mannosyl-oligosaccharide alpha-1,2-mannosidase isoform B [Termitomyces sp. J132]|nr:Mannosyl-oligosaccharide alpha-1,2-mannosidase isoform B [Termitomyces sp. J132]